MTREEAIKKLKELDSADQEASHWAADEILLCLLEAIGYEDVSAAYRQARNDVGFWYA